MAGAPADLLVVAGNPAEDILATRDIVAVFQAGQRIDFGRLDHAAEQADE